MMWRAFPDLHHVLVEEDIVAFHPTMTGTHLGVYDIGPFRTLPPTGRKIRMRHMHFLRWQDNKNTELWHLMDTPSLMRQLTGPEPARTLTSCPSPSSAAGWALQEAGHPARLYGMRKLRGGGALPGPDDG